MPLTRASVAEMMRGGQKDDELSNSTTRPFLYKTVESLTKLADILLLLGSQGGEGFPSTINWIAWSSEVDVLATVLYYAFTTVSGQQTIGEEYVNIVQVDSSYKRHPSLLLRSAMVLMNCVGPYVINKLVEKLMKYVAGNSWMAETKKLLVRDLLTGTNNILQWCYKVQRSLFFLRLSSANIAKHVTSVNYVSIRRNPLPHYKWFTILGYFGLAQCLISFFQGMTKGIRAIQAVKTKSSRKTPLQTSSQSRCPLCYDSFQNITCTPCGHLFCWNCIYPWAAAAPRCPICRLECEPKKLVLLVNFDL